LNTKLEDLFKAHRRIILGLIGDIHKLTESKYRTELDVIEKRVRASTFVTIPTIWEGISEFLNSTDKEFSNNVRKLLYKKWDMAKKQAEKLDVESDNLKGK
jgi:hypothetical protein